MARPLSRILTITLIALLGTSALATVAAAEDPVKAPSSTTLRGVVQDAEGNPVPSATVVYSSYDPYAYTQYWTGTDGAYTLDVPAGRGTLVVSAKGFERAELPVEVTANGATVPVTLTPLPPATATLEGRVLDAEGNPLAGALVYLNRVYSSPQPMPTDDVATGSAEGSGAGMSEPMTRPAIWCCEYDPRAEGKQTTTDENGRFTLTHYGGDYTLSVRAKGFIPVQDEKVTLVDDQTVTRDLALKPVPKESVTLSGIVRDAQTGLPVANARVDVYNVQWSRWYPSVFTDATGTYETQVLPGYTRVSVSADRHSYGYGMPEAAVVDPDTSVSSDAKILPPREPVPSAARNYFPATAYVSPDEGATLAQDFSLVPKPDATIVLIGYVVDEKAQKGIPGATVHVNNLVTGEWGSAVTDATGSYKILVNAGYLSISTWVDGYFERSEYLIVKEDEKTVRHDLMMTEGRSVWIDWYGYEYGYDAQYLKGADGAVPETATLDEGVAGSGSSSAPSAPAPLGASRSSSGTSLQAYQGSGGGLPPYGEPVDTETTDEDGAGDVPAKALRTVPGAGMLLAGLAVAAALVVARRH